MNERWRVVYDTGIVLQGTLHPYGPSGGALRLLGQPEIEAFLSGRVREEYADVLGRPSVRAKNPDLNDAQAALVLEYLDARMTFVTLHSRVIEYPRDPKDEPIINLALTVQAHYLVTRDKDLLDLEKSRDFRLLFPFLRVFDPVAFLQEIERKRLEDSEKGEIL